MRVRGTIRFRLTLLYSGLFLVAGLLLLALSYSIVRVNIDREVGREREAIITNLLESGIDPEVLNSISDFQVADGRTVAEVMADSAVEVRSEALDELVVAYGIAIPVALAISVLLGWWMSGRALAPVKRVTSMSRKLSEENLYERIALDGPDDEIKELADTLDEMLARLEVAFISQRRFAADVSHELRTPLSIIKAEAEVTLGDAQSTARERRLARSVNDATDRAEALIDSLLALARSESNMADLHSVDLAELTGDVVGERIDLADAAGVEIELDLGSATVQGDKFLLERLVANLIDNGIHHNLDESGWIRIAVDSVEGIGTLEVSNSGACLSEEQVELIAEPFHRLGDGTRPGFGLGMTIVRSVVEAHDGEVSILPRSDGGLNIHVELPSRQDAATV
jgi:signal transduction histidine kinase